MQVCWSRTAGWCWLKDPLKDKVQTGLVIALDLEDYDYTKGSQTLIRATEGTIVDRLPRV